MRPPLPHFAELICDTASEAMSGAQDMDTGIGDLARAAALVLADDIHEIIKFEMDRIGKLCGPEGSATLLISSSSSYAASILVYPAGSSKPTSKSLFGKSLPALIAEAETYAASWARDHRVATAADLGLEVMA